MVPQAMSLASSVSGRRDAARDHRNAPLTNASPGRLVATAAPHPPRAQLVRVGVPSSARWLRTVNFNNFLEIQHETVQALRRCRCADRPGPLGLRDDLD